MLGRMLFIPIVLMTICPVAKAHGNSQGDLVVHGTINIVLANENGIVVLTDSMLTEGSKQLPEPGQKLFQLDDRTICTIAGFVSAPGPAPELYTSSGAIIRAYREQFAGHSPQSIAQKLASLGFLFNFYLTSIANVRDTAGETTPVHDYQFELIVAGYDIDGRPKIGKIILGMTRVEGFWRSNTDFIDISDVGTSLKYVLGGQPDVAQRLLDDPSVKKGDATLDAYAVAQRENGGQSLAIQDMEKLAVTLARYTADVYPSVGGRNQVAVLQGGRIVSIQQQAFPDAPKLFRFNLFEGNFLGANSFNLGGTAAIFVKNTFEGGHLELAGNYFFGNTFKDATVAYSGGLMDFDPSNKVENCVLVIGTGAKDDNREVRKLTHSFKWSRVVYERR